MISMPYDPRCETIRFVWRKVRFVFAAFWPNRGPKCNGLRGGHASVDCHGEGPGGVERPRLSTGRRARFPESLRSQRRKRQTAFTVSLGLVSRRSTGGQSHRAFPKQRLGTRSSWTRLKAQKVAQKRT